MAFNDFTSAVTKESCFSTACSRLDSWLMVVSSDDNPGAVAGGAAGGLGLDFTIAFFIFSLKLLLLRTVGDLLRAGGRGILSEPEIVRSE